MRKAGGGGSRISPTLPRTTFAAVTIAATAPHHTLFVGFRLVVAVAAPRELDGVHVAAVIAAADSDDVVELVRCKSAIGGGGFSSDPQRSDPSQEEQVEVEVEEKPPYVDVSTRRRTEKVPTSTLRGVN